MRACAASIKARSSAVSLLERMPRAALHHSADLPRYEFVGAEAVRLGFAFLARGDAQHQLEDLPALLGDGGAALDDGAAVHVHVVDHVVVDARVRGELYRGRRLAAIDRAAAGGEADEIGAACDLP